MWCVSILLFVAFSLYMFLTGSLWVLLAFTISNFVLVAVFKLNFYKMFKYFLKSLIFVGMVFAFNLIFDSFVASLIVAWRLTIVTLGAFVFSGVVTPNRLSEGFCQLLYPLKIFKVNINDVSLMLVVAFNFIPIISRDVTSLKQTLKARNVKLNLKTFFTQSHLLFIMFFAGIFKRVDELEQVVLARGYKA